MHHGIPLTGITLLTCRLCHKLARGPGDAHICIECIDAVHHELHCPDCDSDVTLAVLDNGVMSGHVAHDDTCPWTADLKHNGGYGIRFGRLS